MEECSICYEYTNCKSCKLCGVNDLCEKCSNGTDKLQFNDWLINCSNTCSVCKKIGCVNCIMTCYQCQNIGEDYPMICINCSKLSKICANHPNIFTCSVHDDTCPECSANKNYVGKYSFI